MQRRGPIPGSSRRWSLISRELYGNAASGSHRFGWQAAEAVERAREQVARSIGAEAREIVFTSGATESNNLAIKGVARAAARRGNHLVTAAREHKAVLDPVKRLARQGWEATIVPCDEYGSVSAEAVADALTDRTVLVSIMAANNEVGTINPIAEIGRLCHERGIVFHTDAAQAVGKIPLDVRSDERRFAQRVGAQDLRPQRDRCALRSPPRPPGPARAALRRRRARARPPERDGRGPSGRGAGIGRRAGGSANARPKRFACSSFASACTQGIAGRVPAIRFNGPPDAPTRRET